MVCNGSAEVFNPSALVLPIVQGYKRSGYDSGDAK